MMVRKPRRDLQLGDVYRLTSDQRGWFTWSNNFSPECWLYPDAEVEVVGVLPPDAKETRT